MHRNPYGIAQDKALWPPEAFSLTIFANASYF
jgi:hypothetical protein